MKTLVKLAIVALLANATWHLGVAYSQHYKFTDSISEATEYGTAQSEEQLSERVLSLAAQFDVPISREDFTLRRIEAHTVVDGSYQRVIEFAPGFSYPWPFTWHIDTVKPLSPDTK